LSATLELASTLYEARKQTPKHIAWQFTAHYHECTRGKKSNTSAFVRSVAFLATDYNEVLLGYPLGQVAEW